MFLRVVSGGKTLFALEITEGISLFIIKLFSRD